MPSLQLGFDTRRTFSAAFAAAPIISFEMQALRFAHRRAGRHRATLPVSDRTSLFGSFNGTCSGADTANGGCAGLRPV